MTKQDKLSAAMKDRRPATMRQAITPVNILAPEVSTETEREKRTENTQERIEREKRTEEPNGKDETHQRTEKAPGKTEREKRTVFAETKRQTTRESFEVYADQIERIEALRALYKKKTGKPLTKSRVVREALDVFFPLAFDAYKEEEEP